MLIRKPQSPVEEQLQVRDVNVESCTAQNVWNTFLCFSLGAIPPLFQLLQSTAWNNWAET
jgi:hypothetical protein